METGCRVKKYVTQPGNKTDHKAAAAPKQAIRSPGTRQMLPTVESLHSYQADNKVDPRALLRSGHNGSIFWPILFMIFLPYGAGFLTVEWPNINFLLYRDNTIRDSQHYYKSFLYR